MKVSELGELGLINLIAKIVNAAQNNKVKAGQQLILGIGDDAAAWYGDTSIQLAKVDSLRENIHFSLDTTSWEDLGWKALAINLSDIAAMGGLPKYALVSLALPESTDTEDIIALYKGILDLAQQFGVAIVGGDTDSAPLIDITISVIGSTRSKTQPLLTRSAAKPGEKVAITGYVGTAAAGLDMLTKHLQFDPEATAILKRAFQRPFPRVAEGQILVEQGVRVAIDISDGLISDLTHICQASQVSARIEVDRVPIQPAVKTNFGNKAMELALSGGEDYELLFTANDEVINKVKAATPYPITIIGEITAGKTGKVTLLDRKGTEIILPRTGWEHFTQKRG
ncbi:MAG: thiamine-phosphate kinase [Dehalococcoidales bacterium]|nr:thiamine-phosphate kinase [Dehalococcoidales bacterium]